MMDIATRIASLEAAAAARQIAPFLESLAAKTGIPAAEIWAEAERVVAATEGQPMPEVLAWIANDAGVSVEALEAETARLME
jgi:hypothetical protein